MRLLDSTTTSAPPTTPPTGDCTSVELVGNEAERFGLNCVYVKTDRQHNNYPIFEESSLQSLRLRVTSSNRTSLVKIQKQASSKAYINIIIRL